MRNSIRRLLATLCLGLVALGAAAQNFPERQVKFVVPYPPVASTTRWPASRPRS